jgi:hypothetical protein
MFRVSDERPNFAMGLAGGEPALQAVPSVDAEPMPMLPETGGQTLAYVYPLAFLGLGLAVLAGGLVLRRRLVA